MEEEFDIDKHKFILLLPESLRENSTLVVNNNKHYILKESNYYPITVERYSNSKVCTTENNSYEDEKVNFILTAFDTVN
ncbi:hypothetical protein A0H76_278 [Hepatospora eriocheir]|uniref:Uncharacterized protein n=1 Tax=Hepatospora eriocheir TaxID=1081669 RepID=A0A1X0QAV2_9MICR|nr:hypothetical protein HERIO_1155 [Hepatospora eriocheir]ORD99750.1 hypothetical protein A0H76_278 [Hepatospora eriocheir]